MRSLILLSALMAIASAIPNNIIIRPVSRTSVSISWRQEFDPQLKGFTIHYHNGDTQSTEWLTKTIWDPRASEATIDGLRSEGEYSFCVRSIMTGRVCACSDLIHINMATGAVMTDREEAARQDQHIQQQGSQQHQQQQYGGHHQQQQQQVGGAYEIHGLEAGAIGGDYVQLRWRYDGPKPAKYRITYRGYQRYETSDGHWEEHQIDTGSPVELEVEHHVAHGLRPDTIYTIEVVVIDKTTGRPITRPQTIRITTKAYIL